MAALGSPQSHFSACWVLGGAAGNVSKSGFVAAALLKLGVGLCKGLPDALGIARGVS
jgi:hypothetical protein